MHVLIITSWYKTPAKPYIGSFFEEQARALMERGIKVGVFYPEIDMRLRSRLKSFDKPNDYIDRSLPTMYHFTRSIVPRSRWINYRFLSLTSKARLRKYIKIHGRPDILHAHCVFSGGIVARYLSSKYSIPYVITEHYSDLIIGDLNKIRYNRNIIKKVYKDSSVAIAVSNSFAEDLSTRYNIRKDDFIVIPNLVSDLFFEKNPLTHFKEELILFTNSFLTPKKNHRLILDGFSLILREFPSALLYIGGDGFLGDALKKYSSELQISSRVIFLGALERKQVKEYLDLCDIFLSASTYETFGIAIIEALACGKPVVATDSGGPRDIIDEGDGLLISKHDSISFSEGVLKVAKNYDKYNPALISEKCYSRFSEEFVSSRLIGLYKEVLSK